MSEGLKDKNIIVTGAGSGIGMAASRIFAQQGAKLVLVDMNADTVTALARSLGAEGADVWAITADISKDADVENYVRFACETFGTLDGFFSNAGIGGPIGPLVDLTGAQFRKVIDVNLVGAFLGLRQVLKVMYAQKRGAIVFTGSVASASGLPFTAAYNASKHGVLGLVRSAAVEAGKYNVRVNAVLPGMVDTPMLRTTAEMVNPKGRSGDTIQNMASVSPLRRPAKPEEIGAAAAFLLSDAASYIHGVGLPVDGGALNTMDNTK